MHIQAKKYLPSELHLLPNEPGIYLFYNKEEETIYVGKSKTLRKRVSSYFNRSQQHTPKTQRMVSEIEAISFTIVNSEYEALVLENNLIRSTRPAYNVLLKYGKGYAYLCITNQRFPKVVVTRRVNKTFGKYYGPFTNLKAMYQMLELIKILYPTRTCDYNLSDESIQKNKYRLCLSFHLKQCKGPCIGLQAEENYNQDITHIENLLKGNVHEIKNQLKEKMQQAAKNLAYIEAQDYKMKLSALENYQAKSIVANPKLGDLDVFGIVSDTEYAFISYLQVKNGIITFTQTIEVKKKLEEEEELLSLLILNFREAYNSAATEILTNLKIPPSFPQTTNTVPKIGDKKKLVELAIKNALFLKQEHFLKKEEYQNKTSKVLAMLQQDLQLKTLPVHIECFDNSNLQGSDPVAAMVVFKKGKPAKADYRHFIIKTVQGIDDYASMREIIARRYGRLIEEKGELPDLIVIDGGKGQLSSATEMLKNLGIYTQVAIISIAKKLEEIYYPEDSYPICINKHSTSLKLLQQIRNEAHRFAIDFHRKKRSKSSLHSQLESIPNIGPKTIDNLLMHFKSIENIQKASLKEIVQQVGYKKAAIIKTYLVQ